MNATNLNLATAAEVSRVITANIVGLLSTILAAGDNELVRQVASQALIDNLHILSAASKKAQSTDVILFPSAEANGKVLLN